MSDWRIHSMREITNITDFVANGSFESLRLNVNTSVEPGFAILARLVDYNAGWKGQFSYVDEASYAFLKKSRLETGDVVVSNVGANAGTVFRIPDLGMPVTLGPNSVVCHPLDPAVLDRRFLYYLLVSPLGQSLLGGIISGSAQPKFNKTSLRQLQVTLPPLDEQQAIAEVLGALDDKIVTNTKLAATVEALGNAKLQALGINAEPENGAVALDTLFDFNPRRTPTSDTVTLIDMKALPTSAPLIETWSQGPKKGGARFMNGDTLLARITPCLENRKTGFVDFLDAGQVGIGSTEFIVMRSHKGLPLGLSYFVATSSRFRDFAIQNMVGTSGRQRVAAADVARFEFNSIERSDLMEFGTWADTNLRLLGSLRTENKTLAATRDALLPQLMSGKLRVKDAESIVLAAV